MALRSLGLRATTLTAATLTAAAALFTLPASAAATVQSQGRGHAASAPAGTESTAPGAGTAAGTEAAGQYKGRVVARSGLYLRDKPTRGSRVIRVAKYGSVVHIFCKTRGDNVGGNDRWYLLTDGTWAWGAARYIENIGAAPRWC
jgi:uncharacterized protein YgiM (DUF1202 family)